jgi:hypothetical protein
MEDVYLGCDLEHHSWNPLNLGWTNVLHRWTQATPFRRWWPILQPLYSREFRTFINARFSLNDRNPGNPQSGMKPGITCTDSDLEDTSNLGLFKNWYEVRLRLKREPPVQTTWLWFDFQVGLPDERTRPTRLAMALLKICEAPTDRTVHIASWSSNDLFVPPGLLGAGIAMTLLKFIQNHVQSISPPVARCEVRISPDDVRNGRSRRAATGGDRLLLSDEDSRAKHDDIIRFYLSAGFQLVRRSIKAGFEELLVYEVPPAAE